MIQVVALLTCYNRKEKTERCIHSLVKGNPSLSFQFVVVDDGSTDGTKEMLEALRRSYQIDIVQGTGNLYYSGGMRLGMQHVLEHGHFTYDYLFMLNDDVDFYPHAIEQIQAQSVQKNNAVIVGVTCDESGAYTYGGVKYLKGIRYRGVGIEDSDVCCDTFNANCVLMPALTFQNSGGMDAHYVHGLGDFDFGLTLRNQGNQIFPSSHYVGICRKNAVAGTWGDRSLPKRERLRKKELPTQAPRKPWFYFLHKHFGFSYAMVYTCTPYIKLLLGR